MLKAGRGRQPRVADLAGGGRGLQQLGKARGCVLPPAGTQPLILAQ